MGSVEVPDLRPEDFVLKCVVPEMSDGRKWPVLAVDACLRQVVTLSPAVRVGPAFMLNSSGTVNKGWTEFSASRKVRVGVTVLSVNLESHAKRTILRSVRASVVGWRLSGELIAWTPDLQPHPRPNDKPQSFSFEMGAGKPVFIDAQVKQALAALVPPNAARAEK
jgi:hypothetical protein